MGLEAVRSGRIQIIPERFTKVYYNWLENIRDWCISRQLWWGHRIPAWHCAECRHTTVARLDPDRCEQCGSTHIEQDPDVLDTWFSSGLWPFSTLGWPDDTPDLRRFYPTTVMETGYDILFFWVARMIMQGLLYTNDIPFETVYLHGLVRDDQGRKMSKTTGNVLDPIALLDGARPEELGDYLRGQYPDGMTAMGADALRFTLLTGAAPGSDMNLSLQRVEGNRNFTNKIWNADALHPVAARRRRGCANSTWRRPDFALARALDPQPPVRHDRGCDPADGHVPVRRSGPADLRLLLERVLRLVPGNQQDRHVPRLGGGQGPHPGRADPRARRVAPAAAPVHPVRDGGDLGLSEASRGRRRLAGRTDRRAVAHHSGAR